MPPLPTGPLLEDPAALEPAAPLLWFPPDPPDADDSWLDAPACAPALTLDWPPEPPLGFSADEDCLQAQGDKVRRTTTKRRRTTDDKLLQQLIEPQIGREPTDCQRRRRRAATIAVDSFMTVKSRRAEVLRPQPFLVGPRNRLRAVALDQLDEWGVIEQQGGIAVSAR